MKTKLINKHNKDCSAVKSYKNGIWPYPWAYIDNKTTYGTKVSPVSNRGSHRWKYLRCNSFTCKAELAFLESDVITIINKDIK